MKLEILQRHCVRPDAHAFYGDVIAGRDGDMEARTRIAGALCWAAFSSPAGIAPIWDLFTAGWFADAISDDAADALAGAAEAELPSAFWSRFAAVLDGPAEGYNAASITAAVASLGGALAPEHYALAEQEALRWPGCADVATRPVPGHVELRTLAAAPEGSLGRTLHDLLVANGYDLEVLDREAISLSALPPALRYTNTRILQMHDVWHLVAGYTTSASHEIAISAFQLAQFGHGYSAMFLATVFTMAGLERPEGFPVLGLLVAEAWRHGRSAPPLMAVPWETHWERSIEELRGELGLEPYQSMLPANLFELAASA